LGVSALNVGHKFLNEVDNTADYVDLSVSGGLVITGFFVSNPVGWGLLIAGGVVYGGYRIAAGDATDRWINQNFGFR